jgi:threonine/homoserine/homoserine lactone efflux protein
VFPKTIILFGAVLPEFADRRAGDVPAQMLLLSLVSFVIALAYDGAGGLAMIGLGLSVAVTGRKS